MAVPSVNVAAKTAVPKELPVTLDLYVMSQCPFGVKAENTIFPSVRALQGLVNFNLYFIANETVGPDGQPTFRSLHGQSEVDENIRHLCAQKHFPKLYMDFILERNMNIRDVGWQSAAQKVGIDSQVIERCAAGDEGKQLLSQTIRVSEKRQANASPTIDINGTPYQGGRTLRSVTLALCDALQTKGVPLPTSCEEAKKLPPDPVNTAGGGCGAGGAPAARPAPVPFIVQVVAEQSCSICAPTLIDEIKQQHPGAKVLTLDAASPEGRALIERYHVQTLPFYLLDKAVEQTQGFGSLRASSYMKVGDRYAIRPGPTTYSPTLQLRRQAVPRHLDVFVESLSPLTVQVEDELLRLLRDAKTHDLTLSMHYIVQESTTAHNAKSADDKTVRTAAISEMAERSPGSLTSRRGETETQENLRQLCLFQHASAGDFFTYLACRNQNLLDASHADACLSMTPAVQQCVVGGEGERLLRQDARLVQELRITDGPVLLWENKYGPFGWQEVDWKALIDGT